MNELQVFLNSWLMEPAVWGVSDCALTVLAWAGHVKGLDVAGDLRLTYDDFGSAQRRTRFFTDPRPIIEEYVGRRLGLPETKAPQRGDIACFKWMGDGERVLPSAGICIAPGMFAMRSHPGSDPMIHCARPRDLICARSVGYADA